MILFGEILPSVNIIYTEKKKLFFPKMRDFSIAKMVAD